MSEIPARQVQQKVDELHRAVAVVRHDGPEAGLEQIDAILARGDLFEYHFSRLTVGFPLVKPTCYN